jgi:hypothetical protein
MQVLSQHSKRALIPQDYVLLLGDSWAKGYGDWLARADPDGNDPYHSAHVIQQRLGRDVLSYGKGGAGSIAGLVLFPARWDRALARYDLAPPGTVAVYFYEGNDLNDDRRYLGDHFPGGPEGEALMDDAAFDAFLRDELDAYLAKKAAVDATLTVAFAHKALRGSIERWWKDLWRPEAGAPAGDVPAVAAAPPPATGRARVAGETIPLPDGLQSPSLELSPEELARSLQVTRRSLAVVAERYAGSRVIVFRIPSPLATYELVSDHVDAQVYEGRATTYPAAQVEAYSDAIGDALAGFAAELGLEYVDLRPTLRAAARERVIHGPNDWRHLSEDGYTVLGEAVAHRIAEGAAALPAPSQPEVTP